MTPTSPEDTARLIELAMQCAREGMTEELVDAIDRGLPIDVQDLDGNTALMLAAYNGHAATVAALVERGADVDLPNKRDQSPVAGAVFRGDEAVVQLLVSAGADLDAGTPSAREAAVRSERPELLD